MAQSTNQPGCVGIHMALASYYYKMKDLNKADVYLDNALKLDPANSQVLWLQAKVRKDQRLEEKIKKCKEKFVVPAKLGKLKMKDPLKVERCTTSNLTPKQFLFEYAVTGKPLIITALVQQMTSSTLSMQHVHQLVGQSNLPAGQQQEQSYVKDCNGFIDDNRKYPYKGEWSLANISSEITNDLVIPKYVANDFLQRSSSVYRDKWPTLSIESVGATSNMKVESYGLNRWIAVFEGRIRFSLVGRDDVPCLYPYSNDDLDIAFNASIADPDMKDFPLLSTMTTLTCVLEPGEFLFIPCGTAYSTECLDDSMALSANYVDLSNLHFVKEELRAAQLSNPVARQLYEELSNQSFPSKMWSAQNDISWENYKRWPNEAYQEFDITERDCS